MPRVLIASLFFLLSACATCKTAEKPLPVPQPLEVTPLARTTDEMPLNLTTSNNLPHTLPTTPAELPSTPLPEQSVAVTGGFEQAVAVCSKAAEAQLANAPLNEVHNLAQGLIVACLQQNNYPLTAPVAAPQIVDEEPAAPAPKPVKKTVKHKKPAAKKPATKPAKPAEKPTVKTTEETAPATPAPATTITTQPTAKEPVPVAPPAPPAPVAKMPSPEMPELKVPELKMPDDK